GGGSGDLPLRQVDVLAERLHLLGGQFPQARLRLQPVAGALAVEVDGPALAGKLQVPDAKGEPVQGRFTRLHWQPEPAPTERAAGTAPAATAPVPADRGVAAEALLPGASEGPHGTGVSTAPAPPAAGAEDGFDPARSPPLVPHQRRPRPCRPTGAWPPRRCCPARPRGPTGQAWPPCRRRLPPWRRTASIRPRSRRCRWTWTTCVTAAPASAPPACARARPMTDCCWKACSCARTGSRPTSPATGPAAASWPARSWTWTCAARTWGG